MNNGVYNRSLFRKKGTEARDQLRRMGGIMASSPELMQAGMMDRPPMGQAPMAPQTGQGEVRFMAPNLLQPAMPTPQQPMMPQPQRPMPTPQQPMMPQPAMNLSAAGMVQPQMAYRDGGDVSLGSRGRRDTRPLTTAAESGNVSLGSRGRRDTQPPVAAGMSGQPSTGSGVRLSSRTFDQAIAVGSNTAAAAAESGLPADLQKRYAQIDQIMNDPDISDAQKAKAIADTLGLEGAEEDPEAAVVNAAQKLGLDPAREARIDSLNKAMLGFAIAAGDSPLASENIANGMLAGLKQIRETEVRRAEADLAARTGALEDEATSWFDTPRGELATQLVQKMAEGTMAPDDIVKRLNQLDTDSPRGARLGDQFRQALAGGATPPTAVQTRMAAATPETAPEAEQTPQDIDREESLRRARAAMRRLETGPYTDEERTELSQKIRDRLIQAGINPDLLQE